MAGNAQKRHSELKITGCITGKPTDAIIVLVSG